MTEIRMGCLACRRGWIVVTVCQPQMECPYCGEDDVILLDTDQASDAA